MLTKKHSNALAALCVRFRVNPEHERLAQELAQFCADYGGPAFNRSRFLAACSLPEDAKSSRKENTHG